MEKWEVPILILAYASGPIGFLIVLWDYIP